MKKIQEGRQLTILQIILYHVLPGVPVIIFAIILASPTFGFGQPIFFSLLIVFALWLVPIQWIILKVIANSEGKTIRSIIGYTAKMPIREISLWAIPGIVLAAVVFTLGAEIERPIWSIFYWVPNWFFVDRYAFQADNLLLPTLVLNFIFRGILLPFTEEIYFRGFLLPRMGRLGKFAPLISAALFSVYHLFAPWENITRMLAVLPFVYIVWYKKNIYIGIISHCVVNLLSCSVMLFTVLH